MENRKEWKSRKKSFSIVEGWINRRWKIDERTESKKKKFKISKSILLGIRDDSIDKKEKKKKTSNAKGRKWKTKRNENYYVI